MRILLPLILQDIRETVILLTLGALDSGSGEGKGVLVDSVRGHDLYIMLDVCNYSLEYTVCGFKNHMSPDDHYADLKRVIAAAGGKARRINVIMPFLYESKTAQEQEENLLTVHLCFRNLQIWALRILLLSMHMTLEYTMLFLLRDLNLYHAYQFIKYLLLNVDDLHIDSEHMMVISPDKRWYGTCCLLC